MQSDDQTSLGCWRWLREGEVVEARFSQTVVLAGLLAVLLVLQGRHSRWREDEHFWVGDLKRQGNSISGQIDNQPESVTTVKAGQRITINKADTSDWVFVRNGKMAGNETLKVLFNT
jgi:uncharacterized protein YegJ (DUF2314 family)